MHEEYGLIIQRETTPPTLPAQNAASVAAAPSAAAAGPGPSASGEAPAVPGAVLSSRLRAEILGMDLSRLTEKDLAGLTDLRDSLAKRTDYALTLLTEVEDEYGHFRAALINGDWSHKWRSFLVSSSSHGPQKPSTEESAKLDTTYDITIWTTPVRGYIAGDAIERVSQLLSLLITARLLCDTAYEFRSLADAFLVAPEAWYDIILTDSHYHSPTLVFLGDAQLRAVELPNVSNVMEGLARATEEEVKARVGTWLAAFLRTASPEELAKVTAVITTESKEAYDALVAREFAKPQGAQRETISFARAYAVTIWKLLVLALLDTSAYDHKETMPVARVIHKFGQTLEDPRYVTNPFYDLIYTLLQLRPYAQVPRAPYEFRDRRWTAAGGSPPGLELFREDVVRNLDHQLGEILDILDNDKEEGEDD